MPRRGERTEEREREREWGETEGGKEGEIKAKMGDGKWRARRTKLQEGRKWFCHDRCFENKGISAGLWSVE